MAGRIFGGESSGRLRCRRGRGARVAGMALADVANSSAPAQIHRSHIDKLQVAWPYDSSDKPERRARQRYTSGRAGMRGGVHSRCVDRVPAAVFAIAASNNIGPDPYARTQTILEAGCPFSLCGECKQAIGAPSGRFVEGK